MSVVGVRLGLGEGGWRSAMGFTLIELLVTVLLLGILAVIAVPSFTGLINSNRLAGSANDIVAALQTARLEAVSRGRGVVVCPTPDGGVCGGSDWSRLIVFSDRNGNRAVDPAQDVVLRDVGVAAAGIQVTASPNVETSAWIHFGPDGLAWVGNRRSGVISICSTRLPEDRNTRDVQIAASRVSVATRNGTAECLPPSDT